ncbi:hypothetical protein ACF0H5_021650 [Mactra antiquata]
MDQQEETQLNTKDVCRDLGLIQETLADNPDQEQCAKMSEKIGDIIERIKHLEKMFKKDKDEQISKLKEVLQSSSSDELHNPNKETNKKGSYSWPWSKAKAKVQILNSIHTNASVKFATALKKTLSNFECLMLTDSDGLNNSVPLIVVCLHSTRLKPDIELALAQVNYTPRYVVLIVHTGTESNLPTISSSKKLGGNKDKITFIDVGFDVDYGGIYKCQLNVSAMRYLEEYIKMFG